MFKKELEWTFKDKDTYYRVTALLTSGKPDTVSAIIQVKGTADTENIPREIGNHLTIMMKKYFQTQKEKENAKRNQT